ncbi:MAG: hypothetical protein RLZZ387_5116 [Chloroflexota bacterium]
MRTLVFTPVGWLSDHRRFIRFAGSILLSLVLLVLAVPAAHAESPFNDPNRPRPIGGGAGTTAGGEVESVGVTLPAFPGGYTELPSPLLNAPNRQVNAAPARAPYQQAGPETNPNNPLAWIGLGLNPGKWLLDSVLGATTGIIYSLASIFEVLGRFGNGQVVDISGSINSASDTAFNMLFTTPESLTVAWAGASGLGSPEAMHNIIRQVALSILVIVCTYRAVFVLTGSNLRGDLVDLAIAFIAGVAGIQGAWWFCTLFVRAGNVITTAVLQSAFGSGLNNWIPLDPATYYWSSLSGIQGASLAVALVTLAYWAILALLALHAIARIVMVNLMLIVSPLAGLAIVTGGGWNYARVWFFRFVELLATPLIWGITLGFARSLMSGFGVDTHAILGPILAIFAMCMVFRAPKLLGFAAQEAVTGARTLARMAERATFAAVTAGGAAAGAAAGAASAAESAPPIIINMPGAPSGPSSHWDGPSFGAAPPPAALPPPAGPNVIDQED